MRGAGSVDGLHLVSAQFTSSTNSMGDEVTDVSLTVSNASPTCLGFRLASLDWMVNNTDEYGSFDGLPDSVGTLPCGATTSITLRAQSEVSLIMSNTTLRCAIPYWEESQEPGLLRTIVEQVESSFPITLWNFPPSPYGVLHGYSDERQAEAFERRFSETLVLVRPGVEPEVVTTNRGPNQALKPTRPRPDDSYDP